MRSFQNKGRNKNHKLERRTYKKTLCSGISSHVLYKGKRLVVEVRGRSTSIAFKLTVELILEEGFYRNFFVEGVTEGQYHTETSQAGSLVESKTGEASFSRRGAKGGKEATPKKRKIRVTNK